jgi:hypothetical protein
MMKKIISVSFEEQAKAVVADVKIVYEIEQFNPDLLSAQLQTELNNRSFDETTALMDKALEYAKFQTLAKNGFTTPTVKTTTR